MPSCVSAAYCMKPLPKDPWHGCYTLTCSCYYNWWFLLPVTPLSGRPQSVTTFQTRPSCLVTGSSSSTLLMQVSTRGFQMRHTYRQVRTGKDAFMVLTKTKIKERPVSCRAGCSLSSGRFPDVTDTNVGSAEHSSGSSFTVLQSTPYCGSSIRCCNKLKKTN